MTALSQARQPIEIEGKTGTAPVKGAPTIWQGALVVADSALAVPGKTATGLIVLGDRDETPEDGGPDVAAAIGEQCEPGLDEDRGRIAGAEERRQAIGEARGPHLRVAATKTVLERLRRLGRGCSRAAAALDFQLLRRSLRALGTSGAFSTSTARHLDSAV